MCVVVSSNVKELHVPFSDVSGLHFACKVHWLASRMNEKSAAFYVHLLWLAMKYKQRVMKRVVLIPHQIVLITWLCIQISPYGIDCYSVATDRTQPFIYSEFYMRCTLRITPQDTDVRLPFRFSYQDGSNIITTCTVPNSNITRTTCVASSSPADHACGCSAIKPASNGDILVRLFWYFRNYTSTLGTIGCTYGVEVSSIAVNPHYLHRRPGKLWMCVNTNKTMHWSFNTDCSSNTGVYSDADQDDSLPSHLAWYKAGNGDCDRHLNYNDTSHMTRLATCGDRFTNCQVESRFAGKYGFVYNDTCLGRHIIKHLVFKRPEFSDTGCYVIQVELERNKTQTTFWNETSHYNILTDFRSVGVIEHLNWDGNNQQLLRINAVLTHTKYSLIVTCSFVNDSFNLGEPEVSMSIMYNGQCPPHTKCKLHGVHHIQVIFHRQKSLATNISCQLEGDSLSCRNNRSHVPKVYLELENIRDEPPPFEAQNYVMVILQIIIASLLVFATVASVLQQIQMSLKHMADLAHKELKVRKRLQGYAEREEEET